jgi:hypothetical protein
MCAELKALKCNALRVLREVRKIRRSRDLSFFEDAALNQHKHNSLHQVLKHLLVGHDGKPCPAGPRPIISPLYPRNFARYRFPPSASATVDLHRALAHGVCWALQLVPAPRVQPGWNPTEQPRSPQTCVRT